MPADIITELKNTVYNAFSPILKSISGNKTPGGNGSQESPEGFGMMNGGRSSVSGLPFYSRTSPGSGIKVKFNADSATMIRRNPPAQTYEGRHANGVYFN